MRGERLLDTYRISQSTDPSVRAVLPVINDNQAALAELQERLLRLEEAVEDMGRLYGAVPPRPDPRIRP